MNEEKRLFQKGIVVSLLFVALIWLIQFIEWFGGWQFYKLGLYPQQIKGLPGIILMPFIHGSWGHVASNTLPALILGTVLINTYPKVAYRSILMIWLLSGVLTWTLVSPGLPHVGASGVIYGMAAFLFSSGFLRRDSRSIAISFFTGLLYGGMVYGFLPNDQGISWQGHLSGALAGILTAFVFRKVNLPPPPAWFKEEESDENEDHFFRQHHIDQNENLRHEEADNEVRIIYEYREKSQENMDTFKAP